MTNEELIEEVKRYYSDNFAYISSDQPTLSILTNIARHFSEWGYLRAAEKYNEIEYNRQRAEEDTPKDLEEAAWGYASKECEKEAFIAGANWQKQHDAELIEIAYNDGITIGMTKQKEQMLKEAVEGIVTTRSMAGNIVTAHVDYRYKDGQKDRIIIVKE